MPGFSDNLRRAREAAGISAEDLASRVGVAPLWLAHLEAIGAALPDLPHLVHLAEALGCPLDELLAGSDEDYDHPCRRHAALISARLGRISSLLARVNGSRTRREFTTVDEQQVDEPAMLASVCRCRGWVMSSTADLAIAASLEQELDRHIARIGEACERVAARGTTPTAPGPSPAGPAASSPPVVVAPAPSAATAPAAAPRRASTQRTVLWTRPAPGEGEYVCEMVTDGGVVELRLIRGERVLATRPCKNLDEAFGQSSSWKRVPDPETHFALSGTAPAG
jgi:transcriptional regulator with XRE-family HTH domain